MLYLIIVMSIGLILNADILTYNADFVSPFLQQNYAVYIKFHFYGNVYCFLLIYSFLHLKNMLRECQ